MPDVPQQWRGLLQNTLDLSIRRIASRAGGPACSGRARRVFRWIVPVLLAAWVIALGAGVAQGGLVFAPEALAFKPEKLSPANKLKQMFSLTGLSGILKSLHAIRRHCLDRNFDRPKHWQTVIQASDVTRSSLRRIPREHDVAVVLESRAWFWSAGPASITCWSGESSRAT